MKNFVLFILGCALLILLSSLSLELNRAILFKDRSSEVKIHFTFTSTYCGDDPKVQQLVDELKRPKTLAGQQVYIRKGEVNNPRDNSFVFSGTSDDSGYVNVVVPAGKYYVVFEDKKTMASYDEYKAKYSSQTEFYTQIDGACLNEWIKKPELIFEVKNGYSQELSVNKHIPCSWDIPCAEYLGPPPK